MKIWIFQCRRLIRLTKTALVVVISFGIVLPSYVLLRKYSEVLQDKKMTRLMTSEIKSANWTEIQRIVGTGKLPTTIYSGYIIENKTLCSSIGELLLVAIVTSAAQNFDRRDLIRKTWMNPEYTGIYGASRLIFLLGRAVDAEVTNQVNSESRAHGDILQGDFFDSYRALTNKSVMGYRWLSERCKNAKYVMKVDDDVLVNIFHVFRVIIPNLNGKTKTVVCHKEEGGKIRRNNRKSKWYIPPDTFPGREYYPEYCWGYFIFLTGDLIPPLYEAAKLTPFFNMEDVYTWGLLFNRIPEAKRIALNENSFGAGELGTIQTNVPSSCILPLLRNRGYCRSIFGIGNLSGEQMREYWNLILDKMKTTL